MDNSVDGNIETSTKTAYRPLMVQDVGKMIEKHWNGRGYDTAVKLLVDEGLLILQKDKDFKLDRPTSDQ